MKGALSSNFLTAALVLGLSAAMLASCAPTAKEWEPDKDKVHVFSVAFRQLSPEPVYSRTRWVHLPAPLPARELPQSSAAEMRPVFYMQLRQATLDQAAQALARTALYDSYCASSLAKERISISSLGTTDELAQLIAARAGVDVYVDHANHQVRILPVRPATLEPAPGRPGEGPESPSFIRPEEANE